MMSIKIICSVIIVVCSTIIGFRAANRYVLRIRQIRALQLAFAQLESEIISYSTFLPEAVKKISGVVQEDIGVLFNEFADRLIDKSGDSVSEAWQESLRVCKKYLHINSEEIEILTAFGGVLGASDKESQRSYFEIIQNQLKNQEKQAEAACSKYQNMYKSLGLLGGLTIVILLF